MKKVFSDDAWNDYQYWIKHDKKILKKINNLIKDIERDPEEGIGKPKELKHEFEGYSARRINQEHRIIYAVDDDNIFIIKLRYHYE